MVECFLVITILCFFLSYIISKKIFSPSCMLNASFAFSVICALINKKEWGLSISNQTFNLLFWGLMSFNIVSWIIELLYLVLRKEKRCNNANITKFSINSVLLLAIIIFNSIVFVANFYFVLRAVGGNFTTLAKMMSDYRIASAFNNGKGLEAAIPSWFVQFAKLPKALSYILIYCFINNVFYSKINHCKTEKKILYLLPCIIYLFQSMLTGGRTEMIVFLITSFTIWMFHSARINTGKRSISSYFKSIFKISLFGCIVILVFYYTKTIVGRSDNEGIIKYFTRYFGGSIKLLDMYMNNPIKSSFWGEESFYALNKLLNQLGLISHVEHLGAEFRVYNGINLGNVYTAFRYYYADFGMTGVIVLQSLFSFLITIFYKKSLNSNYVGSFDVKFLIYCIISHTIILEPFADFFYGTIISLNYFVIIILIILSKKVIAMLNNDLKRGGRKCE